MDQEFLTLKEAADIYGFCEGYLLERIRQGHLKAFKIGDDWSTTPEWLDECRERLRDDVEQEIESSQADLNDSRVVLTSGRPQNRTNIYFFSSLTVLVVAVIMILASGLVSIYGLPNRVFASASDLGQVKINDESLTYRGQAMIEVGRQIIIKRTGRVAGGQE